MLIVCVLLYLLQLQKSQIHVNRFTCILKFFIFQVHVHITKNKQIYTYIRIQCFNNHTGSRNLHMKNIENFQTIYDLENFKTDTITYFEFIFFYLRKV